MPKPKGYIAPDLRTAELEFVLSETGHVLDCFASVDGVPQLRVPIVAVRFNHRVRELGIAEIELYTYHTRHVQNA